MESNDKMQLFFNGEATFKTATQLPHLKKISSKWSLAGDAQLLSFMQNFSDRIISQSQDVKRQINDLLYNSLMMEVKLNNTFNDFNALANNQFVENRVYDEDSCVVNQESAEEKPKKSDPQGQEAETMMRTTINEVLRLGRSAIAGRSEADADDAKEAMRDRYKDRPLPPLLNVPSTCRDQSKNKEGGNHDDEDIHRVSREVPPLSSSSRFPRSEGKGAADDGASQKSDSSDGRKRRVNNNDDDDNNIDDSSRESSIRGDGLDATRQKGRDLFADEDDSDEELFSKKPVVPAAPTKSRLLADGLDATLKEKANNNTGSSRPDPASSSSSLASEKVAKGGKVKVKSLFDESDSGEEEDDIFAQISNIVKGRPAAEQSKSTVPKEKEQGSSKMKDKLNAPSSSASSSSSLLPSSKLKQQQPLPAKKAFSLFDEDDEDTEDLFVSSGRNKRKTDESTGKKQDETPKQAFSSTITQKSVPIKSIFDDDDEDDDDDIFSKLSKTTFNATSKSVESKAKEVKFKETSQVESAGEIKKKSETMKKVKSIFDDDEEDGDDKDVSHHHEASAAEKGGSKAVVVEAPKETTTTITTTTSVKMPTPKLPPVKKIKSIFYDDEEEEGERREEDEDDFFKSLLKSSKPSAPSKLSNSTSAVTEKMEDKDRSKTPRLDLPPLDDAEIETQSSSSSATATLDSKKFAPPHPPTPHPHPSNPPSMKSRKSIFDDDDDEDDDDDGDLFSNFTKKKPEPTREVDVSSRATPPNPPTAVPSDSIESRIEEDAKMTIGTTTATTTETSAAASSRGSSSPMPAVETPLPPTSSPPSTSSHSSSSSAAAAAVAAVAVAAVAVAGPHKAKGGIVSRLQTTLAIDPLSLGPSSTRVFQKMKEAREGGGGGGGVDVEKRSGEVEVAGGGGSVDPVRVDQGDDDDDDAIVVSTRTNQDRDGLGVESGKMLSSLVKGRPRMPKRRPPTTTRHRGSLEAEFDDRGEEKEIVVADKNSDEANNNNKLQEVQGQKETQDVKQAATREPPQADPQLFLPPQKAFPGEDEVLRRPPRKEDPSPGKETRAPLVPTPSDLERFFKSDGPEPFEPPPLFSDDEEEEEEAEEKDDGIGFNDDDDDDDDDAGKDSEGDQREDLFEKLHKIQIANSSLYSSSTPKGAFESKAYAVSKDLDLLTKGTQQQQQQQQPSFLDHKPPVFAFDDDDDEEEEDLFANLKPVDRTEAPRAPPSTEVPTFPIRPKSIFGDDDDDDLFADIETHKKGSNEERHLPTSGDILTKKLDEPSIPPSLQKSNLEKNIFGDDEEEDEEEDLFSEKFAPKAAQRNFKGPSKAVKKQENIFGDSDDDIFGSSSASIAAAAAAVHPSKLPTTTTTISSSKTTKVKDSLFDDPLGNL